MSVAGNLAWRTSTNDGLRPRSHRIPSTTGHLVGIALLFAAAGMLVSLLVDLVVGGSGAWALGEAAVVTAAVGVVLWRSTRVPPDVSPASAFAAASWTWVIVSLFGALPYLFADLFPTVDDAIFESVSGFTATGSTVLSPIEGTSRGLLFWRQLTQWYGGMGMIVLAVAVLPFLGVGGLDLIGAEAPGPTADRLAPRVSNTAKRLWLIYVGLTAVVVVGLLVTGQDLYDAVSHATSAVATGGFSPYNDSVSHFDSVAVEIVLMVGMLLGATSFVLLWRAARGEVGALLRSVEFRFFMLLVGGATVVITVINVGDGMAVGSALRGASFNAVSLVSTCGFGTSDYVLWAASAQLILLLLMMTGAMSGSTSGAIKLLRVQIMGRFTRRELERVRNPRVVLPINFGGQVVDERVVARVVGFVLVYVAILSGATIVVCILGSDLVTSIGGVATTMGGVGPGLGESGPTSNFLVYARPARVVLMLCMLLGRLEIFPLLLMWVAAARSISRRRRR